MKDGQRRRFGLGWHLHVLRRLLAVGLVGPIALFGCATDDSPGGKEDHGGASGQTGAPNSPTGGASGQAGARNSPTGGSAMGGAATQSQAITAVAGTAATAGSAGVFSGADRCPAPEIPGGTLLQPPSNGFESDNLGWQTIVGVDAHLSRVRDASGACEGASYLVCNGSGGADGWDAPAIEVTQYLTPGHNYRVTLITRFAPSNAPTRPAEVALFSTAVCANPNQPSHALLLRPYVQTDWVRISATFTFSPAFPFTVHDCTRIESVSLYLSPNTAEPYSLQVDDFQIWDLGPSAGGVGGAGGSGGMGGTAGISTAAGVAGNH